MTDLVPFDYEGQALRTVLIDGDPWFVAKDVCAVLGISNGRDAITRLDEDGVGTTDVIDSLGRTQAASIVNESALYELIFQSRRPEAKTFRRWVTGTVLPQIRKTGSYGISQAKELTRADLARMVLAAEEELAVVSAALQSAAPAIAYHDRYVIDTDVVTIKVWGQQFGLTEPQAFQLLRDKKVIYRQSLGFRWSNSAGRKVEEFEHRPYAGRQSFGWFDLRPQHNAPRHHNGQVRQTLYVRQSYALDLGRAVGVAPKAA